MTAILPTAAPTGAERLEPPTWSIGAPRLLAGLDTAAVLGLEAHLAVHGPLPGSDLDRVLAYLDGVGGVAGRGGAGFPLATKIRALALQGRRRLIVNGAESEPGSSKDRVLLRRAPHLVLDGALAAAAAIDARSVVVAVHDERTAMFVQRAIGERTDAQRVAVRVIDGGFVAGEARAVARAVAGGPALPPGRRARLTGAGILLANTETFAQLAVLLRMGPQRFRETGTRDEPGTTLLTVGGAVERPSVVEVPLGTPLEILLGAARLTDTPQAIVVGGYHGSWIAPIGRIQLSRAGLASAGATLGAGVVLVLGEGTCALGELVRATSWLAGQSARQCGPCMFGLPALAADIAALCAGAPAVGAAFDHARAVIGRGACGHPDGASRFVTSGLHTLHDETDTHLAHGTCHRPVLGHLPLGGAA